MGQELTIRRANEKDIGAIFKLLVELGYSEIDRERFDPLFRTLLRHSETIILIAVDQCEQVIGLMTISHRPQLRLGGTLVSIDELIVSEAARGRGVGRALLDQAKSTAGSLQAERLELHTRRTRESYRRQFYVKNGFTEANSALMRLEKSEFNS